MKFKASLIDEEEYPSRELYETGPESRLRAEDDLLAVSEFLDVCEEALRKLIESEGGGEAVRYYVRRRIGLIDEQRKTLAGMSRFRNAASVQGASESADSDALWSLLADWADSRDYQGDKRSQRAEKSENAVLAYINARADIVKECIQDLCRETIYEGGKKDNGISVMFLARLNVLRCKAGLSDASEPVIAEAIALCAAADSAKAQSGINSEQIKPAECKCSLRTKLVGDGCAVCNPKLAEELSGQSGIS